MFGILLLFTKGAASPSGAGSPGVAPPGTPDMPKTSSSMLSLPGMAEGTLHTYKKASMPSALYVSHAVKSVRRTALQDLCHFQAEMCQARQKQ